MSQDKYDKIICVAVSCCRVLHYVFFQTVQGNVNLKNKYISYKMYQISVHLSPSSFSHSSFHSWNIFNTIIKLCTLSKFLNYICILFDKQSIIQVLYVYSKILCSQIPLISMIFLFDSHLLYPYFFKQWWREVSLAQTMLHYSVPGIFLRRSICAPQSASALPALGDHNQQSNLGCQYIVCTYEILYSF